MNTHFFVKIMNTHFFVKDTKGAGNAVLTGYGEFNSLKITFVRL